MKVKARVSFSGIINMSEGEELDIKDELILEDLLKAGYIEKVKTHRKVKANES